jgi:putative two-component system response regulator
MIKPRILVVDDDLNISGLVRLFLERTRRFEVRVENRSSLARSAAREYRPDMILLDVDMPGKDGGEVAQEIRAERALRNVPIMFLTSLISHAESGGRETMRGGMLFLAKPVDPTILIAAVDRALAGESQAGFSSDPDHVQADAELSIDGEGMNCE